LGYEIDDMAHTAHMALASVDKQLVAKDVKASSILRGIVGDYVAEGLSKPEVT
jgi:hypothetical protein